MTQSVCILGRQPRLGLAELESLLGAQKITPIGDLTALVDLEPAQIPFHRLGGTIKLAKLLTILDTTDWEAIEKWLIDAVPPHTDYLATGKMNLGISVYGLSVNPQRINRAALSAKKAIQNYGRSVRIIPNKTAELSSAQVIHNNLTGTRGWELLFIKHEAQTYVAQTYAVQDIEAYGARDQARPNRDAKVGMLPPKLAQTIINLAKGPLFSQNSQGLDGSSQGRSEARSDSYKKVRRVSTGASDAAIRQDEQRVTSSAREQDAPTLTVLDPFCGTGVILQEALLMGYNVCGSDLEPRMVEYSLGNIAWLREQYPDLAGLAAINQGDATSHKWPEGIDALATETYLGRPFSAEPKPEVLKEVIHDVDTIHRKFLQNLANQTKPGFRLCIAVPAWKTKNGFLHLPSLDHLEKLGYTRTSFVHVGIKELIYHRPKQVVARELVVLVRK